MEDVVLMWDLTDNERLMFQQEIGIRRKCPTTDGWVSAVILPRRRRSLQWLCVSTTPSGRWKSSPSSRCCGPEHLVSCPNCRHGRRVASQKSSTAKMLAVSAGGVVVGAAAAALAGSAY